MKFSLALLALPAANAFVAQQPKAFNSALHSTPTVNGSVMSLDTYAAKETKEIFDALEPVKIQGGTLKTCSFNEEVDRVSVFLKTEGRPLNADVELWQGPDNSPQKMSVYLEDGSLRPFRCEIESPGSSNSVSIRNTAEMEFPLIAGLDVNADKSVGGAAILLPKAEHRTVQGGAVYTIPFSPTVKSVQVLLRTDGRPMNARIELLQGPNNTKQIMEIYTEDGSARPFFVIIDTPGTGNVVRIVNTNTIEYPLTAAVEPYMVDESISSTGSSAKGGMEWN